MADATHISSTNGVSLALHDLGGDGDPLVICHATGFCGGVYEILAASLGERRHVWALDLRGHGQSTPPANGDFAWDGLAEDLLAVVDHLGIDRLEAFGHSLGGATVLLAELARPGLVSGAYLFEPIVWPAGFEHDGPNPMAVGAGRRREVFDSREAALARFAGRPPLAFMRADALLAYVTHGFEDLPDGTIRLRCRAESESKTFGAETSCTVDRFEGLGGRWLIAAGERANRPEAVVSPGDLATAVAAAVGDGRLVTYPHLGHFGPFQDPETVAADVLEFLGT